jgi:phage baseplate assembly protein V
MISIGDLTKFLAPLKRKVYLMIGRGILTAIKNTEKTMKIQITGLNGETITDIERLQEYGFESYPQLTSESEVLTVFQNGNRDQGVALVVHDRANRPTDLLIGNVRVYDYNDNKITLTDTGIEIEDMNGNKITCDANGIIILDKNSNKVEMKSGQINVTGTAINMLAASEFMIKGNTAQTEMNKDQALMQSLQTGINAWVPVPNDGGAALKAALAAFLALPQASYANILSTKIKGE